MSASLNLIKARELKVVASGSSSYTADFDFNKYSDIMLCLKSGLYLDVKTVPMSWFKLQTTENGGGVLLKYGNVEVYVYATATGVKVVNNSSYEVICTGIKNS